MGVPVFAVLGENTRLFPGTSAPTWSLRSAPLGNHRTGDMKGESPCPALQRRPSTRATGKAPAVLPQSRLVQQSRGQGTGPEQQHAPASCPEHGVPVHFTDVRARHERGQPHTRATPAFPEVVGILLLHTHRPWSLELKENPPHLFAAKGQGHVVSSDSSRRWQYDVHTDMLIHYRID